MHSDVAVEIAYSGEFFVRPLRRRRTATRDLAPGEPEPGHNTHTDEADAHRGTDDDFDEENPPDDPARYELVIDNDSGTYRPRADLLPTLHAYLASPRNLGALGRVTTLNAFDERLKRWKDARKKAKQGERLVRTGSVASASSSSSGASSGSSVGIEAAQRHPTMRREYTSETNAVNTIPLQVGT